jgi:cell division protein FtsB
MPTRLKRPPFWRHLAVTAALFGFLGYLGYSALNGQFGIESREDLLADISVLEARSNALQAQIDSYRHRAWLFDAVKLDPDILDERARELLNMANDSDIMVMVDRESGEPVSGSLSGLPENQITPILAGTEGQ